MHNLDIKMALEDATELKHLLKPYNLDEFLALDIPERNHIIAPWLPEKGLVMVVAPRGIGKTLFCMSVAYAAASGNSFLSFMCNTPRKVLYIDGEMPAKTMQERAASIVTGFDREPPTPDYFRLLASDLIEDGLPDLSSAEGQALIDQQIGDAELIVLDNLSTLVRSGKENEAESWMPIQSWILSHRRAGRSVMLVHHAGKNGTPRGTSKREDVLDTIISLKRPHDYLSEQGARFEMHFEKARGFYGEQAQPLELSYTCYNDAAYWTYKSIQDADMHRVVELAKANVSVRDIGDELNMSKSTVQRLKDKAKREGIL